MQAVGRPRLNPGEKLDEYIGVAVSASMRERLEREAWAAGYRSLSRYIREKKFAMGMQEEMVAHVDD
jgi:hypothetical protein